MTHGDGLNTVSAAPVARMMSQPARLAGNISGTEFEKLVPADKKLDPTWVKSLFARGEPTVYRGADLKYIGMPVGGICAGQLYLGGDGKLWCWDIFNQRTITTEWHYGNPPVPLAAVEQGFAIVVGGKTVPLDHTGFGEVSFLGQYPVGTVEYRDVAVPVQVTLDAYSPFIPLNTDDSSLPATILRFTVKNTSSAPVKAELIGWLENAVLRHNAYKTRGTRRNQIVRGEGFSFLNCLVEPATGPDEPGRPDIVFEDWNKETYEGWKVEGTAFGAGPIKRAAIPGYQGDVGGEGERVANSHASAPGQDTASRDAQTGKLTSKPFKLERHFIKLWVGGGRQKDKECVNLKVGGRVFRTVTGRDNHKMSLEILDVADLAGQEAVLEIVDAATGPWGNIGVGNITFSDKPLVNEALETMSDFGTMGLALLGEQAGGRSLENGTPGGEAAEGAATGPLSKKLLGALGRKLTIQPGQEVTVSFVLTWYFPNLKALPLKVHEQQRYYASKFDSALAVARYVAKEYPRLTSQTFLWRDTCYDSSLPHWFLDRTFLNTSTLASSTCFRLKNGRFWAWEGAGCCPGTCTHVWLYAQAAARQFPELERDLRERTDFGLALMADGAIHSRGGRGGGDVTSAVDGQSGLVLRAYREHQMSADDAFLKRVWPGVKKATDWLIAKDGDGDGIITSGQHNTLDSEWYGAVAWLSGMYLAALQAAAAMADEMGDAAYAARYREILANGQKKMVGEMFDGEYFFNKVDPKHSDSVNSGTGCEIDQVLGQSWAWQVGLPRVLPRKETLSALKSLWRYNFIPDVGPYRQVNKPGRWFAMAGEAGLLMCTFPRKDWDYVQANGGKSKGTSPAMYFNECMNGFEHQVAGHMIWEGMVLEGLAIERAVHDRYHPAKRNPWNEIECGDHYARSMASYGVFLAACGFEYHGPKGHIGFAPRLTPENFKAPFTAAEGWGTFEQHLAGDRQEAAIHLKYGSLNLRTLALAALGPVGKANATLNEKPLETSLDVEGKRLTLRFPSGTRLNANDRLKITVLPNLLTGK